MGLRRQPHVSGLCYTSGSLGIFMYNLSPQNSSQLWLRSIESEPSQLVSDVLSLLTRRYHSASSVLLHLTLGGCHDNAVQRPGIIKNHAIRVSGDVNLSDDTSTFSRLKSSRRSSSNTNHFDFREGGGLFAFRHFFVPQFSGHSPSETITNSSTT